MLVAETDPNLVDFQLDVFWAFRAGVDPVQLMRRLDGRITMLHLKDSMGPPQHQMVDVGTGVIDWKQVLATAAQTGVRHSFVEHDNPTDPFTSITNSYNYLNTLTRSSSS